MDYYKLKALNNKKKIIVLLLLIIIVAVLLYYFLVYKDSDESINEIINDQTILKEDETINTDDDEIFVDIKGYVSKPGVYHFRPNDNARVNDLITKAGGLLKEADTSTINLSKKLEDEMIIIIYSKNEIVNYSRTQDDLKKKLEICESKLKNDACIKEKEEVKNTKININEASISELETLSGIGKSKAEAIIEYRSKTKFKTINDIMNVDGIGENIFASIKDNITV